ncbi:hypothetical protein pb186bvf_005974 [Paramecium bursaria]
MYQKNDNREMLFFFYTLSLSYNIYKILYYMYYIEQKLHIKQNNIIKQILRMGSSETKCHSPRCKENPDASSRCSTHEHNYSWYCKYCNESYMKQREKEDQERQERVAKDEQQRKEREQRDKEIRKEEKRRVREKKLQEEQEERDRAYYNQQSQQSSLYR